MAQDVVVEIGAKIDQLIASVNEAKGKIGEIGGVAESIKGSFEGLGKVIEHAFSLEAIHRFIERMMELGVETRNMSLMLGVATEDVAGFRFAAESAGTSLETLVGVGERLMLQIQRSTRDAFAPQAIALHNLGLSARDFQGLNFHDSFLKLAEAASHYNNSNNAVTQNLQMLIGRQQALTPLLLQGAGAFEEAFKKGKELGGITSEQTEGLVKLHHEWLEFKLTLVGPAMAAMNVIKQIFEATRHEIELIISAYEKLKGLFVTPEAEPEKEGKPTSVVVRPSIPRPTFDAKQEIERQKEIIDGQLAEVKAGFDRRRIYYQSDVANFGMSEAMKTAAVGQANVAIVQAELDAQLRKRDLYAQNTLEWQKEELKRKQLSEQVNTEILKSTLSTRDQEARLWTDGFKTIQSAWDSQLRGLLTGTTTLTQAMKNIFLDLTIAVIKAFEEMAIKQVASMLAQKTTVLSSITSDVAQAFAGFAAFFAPTLGPGAIPAATGLAAEVQAQATGMAALEQGTDYVPHTGLALIHKGEIVIPSGIAEMIRSGQTSANGGGSTVNLHVSALDAASFASWLRGPAGREMAKHVAQTWNNNRDTRPRY